MNLLYRMSMFAIIMAATCCTAVAAPQTEIVAATEINWTPLNPARGDASPKAATLWGDRAGRGATGFLVRFKKGFSSPPHIHNVTYRGVVIRGLVHNDDPKAAEMWMPAGSFWTQPAGEVHITSAKDKYNIAYIEIGDGPYLVRPPKQAFDNGERPVNVDPSNLVWVNQAGVPAPENSTPDMAPRMTFLWGEPEAGKLNGTMVRLPMGFRGVLSANGPSLRAVVIKGQTGLKVKDARNIKKLEPGSYFGTEGEAVHEISCTGEAECILYVRAVGMYSVAAAS